MNSAPVARTSLLILLLGGSLTSGGCQQPSNPAAPLSPVSPLGANTRVPPPQTGSYAVPNGYYQGQASIAPATAGQFAAAAGPEADYVATETPSLNGWADAAAGPTLAPAVQPAAFESSGSAASGIVMASGSAITGPGSVTGSGAAPRIPASALQHAGAGGTPLRPNLRGMDVVDLTAPATLQPVDPPSLQVIDRGQVQTANASPGSAAPTFRSLSPAEANNAEANNAEANNADRGVVQVSASGTSPAGMSNPRPQPAAPAAAASSSTVSSSTVSSATASSNGAPSTSKAEGVKSSSELPWRKPLR